MKTVTVNGKVYQIGGVYKDSDGEYCQLHMDNEGNTHNAFGVYHFASQCLIFTTELTATPLGTITDAPVELEDGEWYMCDLSSGEAVMCWSKDENTFFYSDGNGFDASKDDALPLYKMVKA